MLNEFNEPIMDNSVTENVKIEPVAVPQKEIETKQTAIKVKEKRNSKDEKSRKKDERNVEQILKGLSDLDPEKKLNAMVKKHMEILDENRKLQAFLKLSDKKIVMLQKEKDQCESERNKAVLTRSRLESLCRELQRQNKSIKEESLLQIREEEEKRKEVSAKFQSTLTEITALMTEKNDKNIKLHEDNVEAQKNIKSVFEEMDRREQQFNEMHQMMKKELLAAEAKLNKVTLDMSEEKERLLKEKSAMLIKLTEYQKRICDLQAIEAGLRSQVNMYTEKYEEFQSALTKSNEVFGGFNQEMEKMSKKILKLEKETLMWKSRWEKTHNALLDMATEKHSRDAEFVTLNKKCALLQGLCKTFQDERATLIAQLKEKSKDKDNLLDQSEEKSKDENNLLDQPEEKPKEGNNLLDKTEEKSKDENNLLAKTEEKLKNENDFVDKPDDKIKNENNPVDKPGEKLENENNLVNKPEKKLKNEVNHTPELQEKLKVENNHEM